MKTFDKFPNMAACFQVWAAFTRLLCFVTDKKKSSISSQYDVIKIDYTFHLIQLQSATAAQIHSGCYATLTDQVRLNTVSRLWEQK